MYHTGAGKCKMFWLEGSKQRKWLHSFSTFQVRTQEAASNMHPWWHFLKTYCIQNLSLFEFLGLFYGRMKWQSWKSSFHCSRNNKKFPNQFLLSKNCAITSAEIKLTMFFDSLAFCLHPCLLFPLHCRRQREANNFRKFKLFWAWVWQR